MYEAKFVNDNGDQFLFSLSSGIAFDIDPLSGIDVSVASSQGFNQVGETVTGMSVGGIRRRITGVVTDKRNDVQIAKRIRRALGALGRGTLHVGGLFCEAIVQKTPEFTRLKNGVLTFSAQVFCPLPYWQSEEETVKTLGGYTPAYRLPINFSTPHRFGVKSSGAFVNCSNPGEVDAPFSVRFLSTSQSTDYAIININTLAELRIHDTLMAGDTVTVGRQDGRLYVVKTNEDGTKTDLFYALYEGSTLFSLAPGDNVLKATAQSGEASLIAYVTYSGAYTGVDV